MKLEHFKREKRCLAIFLEYNNKHEKLTSFPYLSSFTLKFKYGWEGEGEGEGELRGHETSVPNNSSTDAVVAAKARMKVLQAALL